MHKSFFNVSCVLCTVDFSRITDDGVTRRNVFFNNCASPHDCIRAYAYPWQDDSSGPDERTFAHCYLAGKRCPGRDMHAVFNDAIVIDRGLGVDDDRRTNFCVGAHRAHCKNLATVFK